MPDPLPHSRPAAGLWLQQPLRRLGAIAAGFPSPAEEELADVMSLDEYLIRRPEATFLLTARSDDMVEAGIHPGDLLLVEKGRSPRSGQIVVAQADGEWVIRYYVKNQADIRLDPANRTCAPIRPRHALVVGGVVRAVIRRYD